MIALIREHFLGVRYFYQQQQVPEVQKVRQDKGPRVLRRNPPILQHRTNPKKFHPLKQREE